MRQTQRTSVVRWRNVTRRFARPMRHRDDRGSVSAFAAVAVLPLILLGGLAADQASITDRYAMLRRTATAGALAGQTYLASYYQNGGTYSAANMSSINSAVQTAVTGAMPASVYGAVVPTTTSNSTSNVQLGVWDNTAKSFTPSTTNPNAVRVTALATAAMVNRENTKCGSLVGKASVDMTVSAVASFGNGLSSAGGFNTIILNDLSMSFSSEISNQRAADIAILNCISNGTNGNGSVGLSSFDGDPWIHNAAGIGGFPTQTSYLASPYHAYATSSYAGTLVKATSASVAAMTTYIDHTLNYCGTSGMPACTGSNVASGLYSAIQQLAAAGLANTSSNIIVITDGVPNADSRKYSTSDGTGLTPSAAINSQHSWSGCTSSCSDTDLWNAAQAWAAYAGSLGINVSTVYYSGDTTGSLVASYSARLASLVQGQGMALVAPTAGSLSNAFATFCSTMGAAVKASS